MAVPMVAARNVAPKHFHACKACGNPQAIMLHPSIQARNGCSSPDNQTVMCWKCKPEQFAIANVGRWDSPLRLSISASFGGLIFVQPFCDDFMLRLEQTKDWIVCDVCKGGAFHPSAPVTTGCYRCASQRAPFPTACYDCSNKGLFTPMKSLLGHPFCKDCCRKVQCECNRCAANWGMGNAGTKFWKDASMAEAEKAPFPKSPWSFDWPGLIRANELEVQVYLNPQQEIRPVEPNWWVDPIPEPPPLRRREPTAVEIRLMDMRDDEDEY